MSLATASGDVVFLLASNIGIPNAQHLEPNIGIPNALGGPTRNPILVFQMHRVGPPGIQYWYSKCTGWAHLEPNIGIPNGWGGPSWNPILVFPIDRVGPPGIQYWYSE